MQCASMFVVHFRRSYAVRCTPSLTAIAHQLWPYRVLGNIATQYSLAFVGLSVTEVVASSITVVGGTTVNFFLDGAPFPSASN